jgi:nicotinate-nucleotide adenylyltransferase
MNTEIAGEWRLGIMGGTFDPVHYGHLVAAEGARYSFKLAKVIFMPAGSPPHKPDHAISEPSVRYKMTCSGGCFKPLFFVLQPWRSNVPGLLTVLIQCGL